MGKELFKINEKLQSLIDGTVDENTGEVTIDEAAIKALQMERVEYLVSCRNYYHAIDAQVEAANKERDRIAAYVTHLENLQKSIKRMLVLAVPDGEKIKDSIGKAVISWRASEESFIDDPAKVLAFCAEHIPDAIKYHEPTINKTPIKEYCKEKGIGVGGFRVVSKNNIQIR